jgi:hypothetical protein
MRAHAYTLLALAAAVRADQAVLAAPGTDGVLARYDFGAPRDSAAFAARAEVRCAVPRTRYYMLMSA